MCKKPNVRRKFGRYMQDKKKNYLFKVEHINFYATE